MEFRILGPLDASDDHGEPVTLGPRKQRALLARLLLANGRTIAVEQLVDDLWGEDVPDTAVKMIQIHVSHLRKLMPEGTLVTRPPGYALEVESESVDVLQFERLREEGRAALADGDPETAAEAMREALALWRGPALGEFSEPFAAAERVHLEELHLACREDHIDAQLALGRESDLVGELELLVRGHPLRERLRGQLMRALYRAGRHAEALASYREFRDTLDEQLGIEPSPALRDLERQILQHEAGLSATPATRPAGGASPAQPAISYVRSADVAIAYQVIGDGPLDIVLVHGWICTFAPGWERDQIARFYRRLGSMGRLVLFDKRGTGLSDRVNGIATLEERMDDVRAVMDAVGSQRAALIRISEGGPMVTLFAATYPERTAALIALGAFARRTPGPGYAIDIARPRVHPEGWGSMPDIREWLSERAPSIAGDEAAVRWYSTYAIRGASPGAAATLIRMNSEIDVRHVLGTIGVPTLVLHREDEYMREATRYLGSHIPGAEVVAVPGSDHLPWEGDQDAVLDEIERFLATVGDDQGPDRILATVLTARFGDDAARHQAVFRNQLPRFRGIAISETSARFDGPARAIRCARAIVDRTGSQVRVGLHAGECVLSGARPAGDAVDVSAVVASFARPGEVLVTPAVRDLVSGSGIPLEPRRDAGDEPEVFAVG